MNPITSITQGCDFTLRIRAKRVATRGYVNVSFVEIADIHVNLVNLPSTKTPIAYTIDSEGRLLLDIDGETLDCNSYGIEILGYYNNGNWRHQLAPAFQIVRTSTEDNYALTESDERTIDLVIIIGETYLTTKGFNQAMEEHDQDIAAHQDLRTEVGRIETTLQNATADITQLQADMLNAGKVDDIKVNGRSVVSQKQAYITIPEKASDLPNDANYQDATQVQEKIDESLPTKVSDLQNDEGYQTAQDVQGALPTKVSDLQNDSDFASKSYVDGKVAEAGQVDDVKVNGTSVVSQKEANITVPTKVSDLNNDSGFQTAQQVQQTVQSAQINDVAITVDNSVGTPSGTASISNGRLAIALSNIKGEKGDSIVGPEGPQGETCAYDPNNPDTPVFQLATTTGQSQTQVMTQKAVTDELNTDRVWGLTQLSIPSPSGSADLRSINRTTLLWQTQTSNASGVRRAITPGLTYRLVGNINYASRFAFLHTSGNTSGTEPDWAEGCTLQILPAGATIDVVAPDGENGANYIYLEKKSGGSTVIASYLGIVEYTKEHMAKMEQDKQTTDERVEDIESAIWNNADFIPVFETATPSDADAYNMTIMPNGSPTNIFRQIDDYKKRLAYFPKVRIAGGGTLRFTMSGLIGLSVCELPWRELNLAPNSAYYKNTDLIERTFFSATAQTVEIVLKKNTRRVLFLTSSASSNLSPSAITDYISEVTLPVATIGGFTFGSGEDGGNDDKEMMLVRHATTKPSASTHNPYFNLLHYSDIHASSLASESISKAIMKYGANLHAVLCTGDVIYSTIGGSYDGENWWPACGLQAKSLFTLGNHDDSLDLNGNRQTKAWSHNLYFADHITALGYIMPTGYDDSNSPNYKACFWHKDFDNQKVRLIGLDCRNKFNGVVNPATGAIVTDDNNTTNEQEVWLAARLAETLPNSGNSAAGYTVVIAAHYPLDGFAGDNANGNTEGGRVINQKTGEVTNWHRTFNTEYAPEASMRWANSDNVNNIAEIIKYYMNQEGSHFAAYLCGHTHNNLFFYPARYPDILNVCIEMAGNIRDEYYSNKSTMGNFIANIVSFNTSASLMKIVRLGVKSDNYLTPLNFLCYNYATRKIVHEG